MIYKVKRYSYSGYAESEEIREETVKGKTRGEAVFKRGIKRNGKKPVIKSLRIKYRDKV